LRILLRIRASVRWLRFLGFSDVAKATFHAIPCGPSPKGSDDGNRPVSSIVGDRDGGLRGSPHPATTGVGALPCCHTFAIWRAGGMIARSDVSASYDRSLRLYVGAVAVKSANLVCRLIQQVVQLGSRRRNYFGQGFGFDLLLCPGSPARCNFRQVRRLALAVLCASSIRLRRTPQARAVDHHVDPSAVFRDVERDAHFGARWASDV